MITFKEILGTRNISDLNFTQEQNIEKLLKAMAVIREAFDKPMIVTSGFRTYQDQMRINPKSPNSAHTMGLAVDIADNGELFTFIKSNMPLLAQVGLYIEDPRYTPTWIHFQLLPPKSGRRIFIPYAGPALDNSRVIA